MHGHVHRARKAMAKVRTTLVKGNNEKKRVDALISDASASRNDFAALIRVIKTYVSYKFALLWPKQ